jgi:hypothetical protein
MQLAHIYRKILGYFIEDKSCHKVTRTSIKDSLGLTSYQIENKIKIEKLTKKERSLIPETSLYKYKDKSFDNQELYRKALAQSPEMVNAYKSWSSEEDEMLLSLSNKSDKELASIFKRGAGAIRSRLAKIDEDNNGSDLIKDNLFFSSIIKGIDPITAEILPQGHAWLHPKIISDIKEHVRTTKTNNPQTKAKENYSSGNFRISESEDNLAKAGENPICLGCGQSFSQGRANLGYKTCLTCGEKQAQINAPKLNEGLPGTREENKKMRAQVWGEIRKRSKGN